MKNNSFRLDKFKNKEGISAVLVVFFIIVFLGFAALAIDIFHIVVARNELQNAADAGALAGARFLYNGDGTSVNPDANRIAYEATIANKSEKVPVEVNWTGGNERDVQRGHWSFGTRTFTPNDSLTPPDLWNKTTEELDQDPNFINAIRVKTRRENTPVASFFAKIFGLESFNLSAESIAYIGFAGTLAPREVDQPIAICKEALKTPDGKYICSIGRMINSGQNLASRETGGWTDFNQDNPCLGGTNATSVRSLVCREGNPGPIILGQNIATNGGEIQTAFNALLNCWESKSNGKTEPWELTLAVIEP